MISEDDERMLSTLQLMPPFLKVQLESEEFPVADVVSLREKKVHGWSLAGIPCCCDNTAPTPVVEEFTSTTKGVLGSGWMRSSALVNTSMSCW